MAAEEGAYSVKLLRTKDLDRSEKVESTADTPRAACQRARAERPNVVAELIDDSLDKLERKLPAKRNVRVGHYREEECRRGMQGGRDEELLVGKMGCPSIGGGDVAISTWKAAAISTDRHVTSELSLMLHATQVRQQPIQAYARSHRLVVSCLVFKY